MKNLPLVTICIPTFNSEDTIKKTLYSLLNQSYKNYKIIVVDNNSSDKTIAIVKSFKNKKIQIFKYKKTVNAEKNFNRCIKLSKGEYTAIYHSDDIYDKEIIFKQVCFLEKNKSSGVVFSEGRLIDKYDNYIANISTPFKDQNNNFNYTFEELFKEIITNYNFLICPTAMVRTSIYKNYIKKFRYNLFGNSSDLDVWLRISQKYSVGIIRQKLISYRISSTQQTSLTRSMSAFPNFFKVIDAYIKNIKKIQNINLQNYIILKTYTILFLYIWSLKKNEKIYQKFWLKKFKIYYKKISKYKIFSKKKIYIKLIFFSINFFKNFFILRNWLINYLYIRFYKV
jgi:glycosyltransferase involved in cell wall biosynthesis